MRLIDAARGVRLRPLLSTLLVALTAAHVAGAQPAKKKKPKKPKTEQTDDLPGHDTPSHDESPPLDTNLKEEDAPAPSTNPWVASGEAKKRGGEEPKDDSKKDRVASAWSDNASERKKKDESDWISRPLAVAAAAGYASANLRIGFGVRVGYSISDHFYVGGAFTYHLGTRFGDTTLSFYYPAAELGYDYHVQGFTIRPYAGAGVYFLHVTGASADDLGIKDGNALAIYPGIQFDYQYGPGFFGVDLRFLFSTQDGQDTSIGFFAVGGTRF